MTKLNYKKFSKHAEILVKESKHLGSRAILQGIHHNDIGTLTVTNSHYMYQARGINAPINTVTHAITGEVIDEGEYPNTDRLIPDLNNAEKITTLNLSELVHATKAMQYGHSLSVTRREALFNIKNNKMKLVTNVEDTQVDFSYDLQTNDFEEVEMRFNSQYLLNSLEMIADMLPHETVVKVYYYGKMRPFIITPDSTDDLQALILPVREY